MKYRYIIINEDCCIEASNEIPNKLKDSFNNGIIDVIDYEHGEIMTSFEPEEWENLEVYNHE